MGTRTPGKGRLTSETRQPPRSGGSRRRHSRVVGSRPGVRPGSPPHTILSVCPSVRPGTGPARPSGWEKELYRPAPRAAVRAPRSALLFPPPPPQRRRPPRSAPPRPGRLRQPRAAHGESGGAGARSRGPTWPPRREELQPSPAARARTAPPTPRAPRPRLRRAHLAPLRVAHMDPSGPPPSSPCKLQQPAACGSRPTGSEEGLGWGSRGTHAWGVDCLEIRSLNRVLSLNSSPMLVDLQNEIKVDNSGISV